jgi:hypothetical protein
MSTFVLVHGACRDGSAWGRIIERLNNLGHKAFGPTWLVTDEVWAKS